MRRYGSASLLILVACSALTAEEPRVIDKNTVWSGTVRLEGPVLVDKGVALTIQPGTTVDVKPGWYTKLVVRGKLSAVGTKDKPIRFVLPKKGSYWSGMYIDGAQAEADVQYCHFSNPRKGAVLVRGGKALFEHNQIRLEHYGGPAFICMEGGNALVHDNTIMGKSGAAVLLINASPSVRGNKISGFSVGVQISNRTLPDSLEPFGYPKRQAIKPTDAKLKPLVRNNVVTDGVELLDERSLPSSGWQSVFESEPIKADVNLRGFDRKADARGRAVFMMHSGNRKNTTMRKVILTDKAGKIVLENTEAKLDRTFKQFQNKSPTKSDKGDLLATRVRTVLGQLRLEGCSDTQPSYALIAKPNKGVNRLVWSSPKIEGALSLHWANLLGDTKPELIVAGTWWCKGQARVYVYQQKP